MGGDLFLAVEVPATVLTVEKKSSRGLEDEPIVMSLYVACQQLFCDAFPATSLHDTPGFPPIPYIHIYVAACG